MEEIENNPLVSVIIPSRDRPGQVIRVLESLGRQTLSPRLFEVVVVDDGSREPYDAVTNQPWPFHMSYLRQENQGEIAARRRGVEISRGELLVFLDDDIEVAPRYLECLLAEHKRYPDAVLLGTLRERSGPDHPAFVSYLGVQPEQSGFVSFTSCLSGVLAVGRTLYEAIGGVQPLGQGGRNAWGGMDFGYRAHLKGYKVRRCGEAIAYHDDYALKDLATYAMRWYNVARLAVCLFQKYPELLPQVEMFRDKTPINWRQEPAALIVRKMARRIASSKPALWMLERAARLIEQRWPTSALLRPVYRWIVGGYIYRGYRQGLRDFGPVRIPGHDIKGR